MQSTDDHPSQDQAIIFGATGYTGRELARQLKAQGLNVVCHVRPRPGSNTDPAGLGFASGTEVALLPWDLTGIEELVARVRPRWVFSVLGTTRKRAKDEGLSGDIYDLVDRRLSQIALEATQRACSDAVFVYLSAEGVKPGVENKYLAARAAVEQALFSSTLQGVIARPAFVTGPDRVERRPAERVAAAASDALLSGLGALGAKRLRDRYSSLTATQLARALIAAARRASESEAKPSHAVRLAMADSGGKEARVRILNADELRRLGG